MADTPPNPYLPRPFDKSFKFKYGPRRQSVQVFDNQGKIVREVPWSDNPNMPSVAGNLEYMWLWSEVQAGRTSISLPDPDLQDIPPPRATGDQNRG